MGAYIAARATSVSCTNELRGGAAGKWTRPTLEGYRLERCSFTLNYAPAIIT